MSAHDCPLCGHNPRAEADRAKWYAEESAAKEAEIGRLQGQLRHDAVLDAEVARLRAVIEDTRTYERVRLIPWLAHKGNCKLPVQLLRGTQANCTCGLHDALRWEPEGEEADV